MERKELLKIIRQYSLAIEVHNETFKLISDTVTVNDICFRDVAKLNIVENTLWIEKASIDISMINYFRISESEEFRKNEPNIKFKLIQKTEE